jgi:hypothetical protein
MVFYSGISQIQRDPIPVRVIDETIDLPLKYLGVPRRV